MVDLPNGYRSPGPNATFARDLMKCLALEVNRRVEQRQKIESPQTDMINIRQSELFQSDISFVTQLCMTMAASNLRLNQYMRHRLRGTTIFCLSCFQRNANVLRDFRINISKIVVKETCCMES